MVTVTKFLFDTEFLAGEKEDAAVEPAPPPEPTFSQAELDAARAAGFADGRKRALVEAASASDRLAAEALEAIGTRLAATKEAQDRALDEARRGAVAIAAAIAGKIAPEIARRAAVEGIAALVAERLPDLMEEPRVVVRLNPAHLDLRIAGDLAAKAPGDLAQAVGCGSDPVHDREPGSIPPRASRSGSPLPSSAAYLPSASAFSTRSVMSMRGLR